MAKEEEKTLGVKSEEKNTSEGNHQPEKENPDTQESDKEEGEKVEVSKAELEKLKKAAKDRDNYRDGLLSLKDKVKNLEENSPKSESDYLSKKEFYKAKEQSAIKQACEDQAINDNWADIMQYYNSTRGKNSVDDILQDIDDAKTLWEKYSSEEEKDEEEDEDKKAASELSSEKAKPSKGSKPKGGKEKKKKKSILRKGVPIQEWYE